MVFMFQILKFMRARAMIIKNLLIRCKYAANQDLDALSIKHAEHYLFLGT